MSHRKVPSSFVAAAILFLTSAAWAAGGPPVKQYDSELAVAWFDLFYDVIKAERIAPPPSSRNLGIAGVALYEALVAGMKDHRTLSGQVNELPTMPPPEPNAMHDWALVAHGALGRVADTLYANGSSGTKLAIATMKAELGKRLAAKRQRVVVERSLAYGTQVADAVLAWAATDGFASHDNCAFTPPVGPGLWEPTPPAFQPNPLQPCWGQLRPFVLASGNDCAPPPPHPFSTDPNSLLFGEAQEVYTTVNGLTPEQAEIARFWADGAGTGTPPGHWILLTGQLLADQERSLDVAAEAYARVGMAVADAFIECWFVKYQYNLLRPVTFIQDNIDAAWRPLITTPPFPEYTSGHSTQSGAASTVLTDLFGVTAFTDETHSVHNPELGLAPRSFASLDQAAGEAAVSRLYGGIHYRRANEQGLASGQCVGQAIVEQIRFR